MACLSWSGVIGIGKLDGGVGPGAILGAIEPVA